MQKRGATRSQQTKTRFPFLCHFSATITVVNVFPKCAVDYVGWTFHVARETLKILKMQIIIYSKVWKSSRESTKISAWAISPQAGCNDDRQNIWQTSTVFILYDKLFLNCLNTCTTAEVWISNERRKPEKYKSLRQSTFLHIQLFHGSHGIKTNLLFVSSTWPAF